MLVVRVVWKQHKPSTDLDCEDDDDADEGDDEELRHVDDEDGGPVGKGVDAWDTQLSLHLALSKIKSNQIYMIQILIAVSFILPVSLSHWLSHCPSCALSECTCTTFDPATIATMANANVKHNPNPNPSLHPYPTLKQKPNHYPHSKSMLLEISSQEQLSPEEMSDHPLSKRNEVPQTCFMIVFIVTGGFACLHNNRDF